MVLSCSVTVLLPRAPSAAPSPRARAHPPSTSTLPSAQAGHLLLDAPARSAHACCCPLTLSPFDHAPASRRSCTGCARADSLPNRHGDDDGKALTLFVASTRKPSICTSAPGRVQGRWPWTHRTNASSALPHRTPLAEERRATGYSAVLSIASLSYCNRPATLTQLPDTRWTRARKSGHRSVAVCSGAAEGMATPSHNHDRGTSFTLFFPSYARP